MLLQTSSCVIYPATFWSPGNIYDDFALKNVSVSSSDSDVTAVECVLLILNHSGDCW